MKNLTLAKNMIDNTSFAANNVMELLVAQVENIP